MKEKINAERLKFPLNLKGTERFGAHLLMSVGDGFFPC